MPKKQTLLFILLLAVFTMVASGCTEQPENNQSNNNQQQEEQQEKQDQNKEEQKEEAGDKKDNNKEEVSTEIKYLDNGEIDTGDWKTYRNEVYGLTMKYPLFLEASKRDAETFVFDYIDNDYYYYFQKYVVKDVSDKKLDLEKRKKYIIDSNNGNPGFQEIKVENGYGFFVINHTKSGYSPKVIVMSENATLSGLIELYSEDLNFKDKQKKYIEILKAITKTIKFDE